MGRCYPDPVKSYVFKVELAQEDDGRWSAIIHYHHASDTLPRGTLGSVISATRGTEDDARRLGLIS